MEVMVINKEELVHMYTRMLTIRRFEERAALEYHKGVIPGVIHSYIGQEAIAVGVCANLRLEDRIVSNHRGHGHCIAKGADLKRMMAEIFGKKTGYCKGKGGSMHIADFSIGMLGANGIVAAGLPIAIGSALAAQLEGGDRVSVVFFGDGACQEGEFHESLNLASMWKLPILFACENNLYGGGMRTLDFMPVEDIGVRAASYAMPGIGVDGNDLIAVYEATEKAVDRARAGEGPSLLEFKTYRWRSHFESDTITDLRPPEELEAWKKKCPIAGLKRKLLEKELINLEELEAIDTQIMSETEKAVKFAVNSPFPDPEDALEGIFQA
jgi:pyruvate dehydrogenase E1 component alpha subunit